MSKKSFSKRPPMAEVVAKRATKKKQKQKIRMQLSRISDKNVKYTVDKQKVQRQVVKHIKKTRSVNAMLDSWRGT